MSNARKSLWATMLLFTFCGIYGCSQVHVQHPINSKYVAKSYVVNEAMTHVILNFPEKQTLEFPMPDSDKSAKHAHEWGTLELSWEKEGAYNALVVIWNGQPVSMKLD